ncbi:MAG: PKD domain-containing protein [bacterium]|nr:PKD domain-containing protein [bacterium]
MRTFSIRKRLGLATALALVSLGIAGIVYAAVTFGPSRPTFTWANPANHITFNSITDNPLWGDERQLLKVRDVNADTSTYATGAQVSDNQELVLAVYFHNNAASGLNLTATNTQVKFELPGNTGTTLSPKAYISADNASPNQVWSTADLTSSQPFSVTYEPGTAKLYTNYVNGAQVSDSVVTTGTLIGTNGTDGRVPGCSQFSGYVTIRARVHTQPVVNPAYSCNLLSLTASAGRKVDANVTYTATGGAVFQSVAFDWGDGTAATTTSQTAASHTYSRDGTYTVKSILTFTVGGSDKNIVTAVCTKTVTVTTPTPLPGPQPGGGGKSLPNTGPGDIAGLFVGTSALGGVGHYLVSRRRN